MIYDGNNTTGGNNTTNNIYNTTVPKNPVNDVINAVDNDNNGLWTTLGIILLIGIIIAVIIAVTKDKDDEGNDKQSRK